MGNWLTNPQKVADYDFDQIIEWEGSLKGSEGDTSRGYVPSYGSGLTIGHGVDISRQTLDDLGEHGAGLSKGALAQLSPYMATGYGEYGPTHEEGESGLLHKGHPLYFKDEEGKRKVKLEDDDLNKLNAYFEEKSVRGGKMSYNRIRSGKSGSKSTPKWEDLTKRQRTIMIDFAHNAGPSFIEDSTTVLQNAIATGDWEGVSTELRGDDWAEKDKPRHLKRADYLNEEEYTD